jgi:hypothetical protein
VQVPCDEGLAIYIGPESCGWQGVGADAVQIVEGNMSGRANASVRTTRRGQRPWHVQTLLAREPGDLAIDRSAAAAGPHRKGEEP